MTREKRCNWRTISNISKSEKAATEKNLSCKYARRLLPKQLTFGQLDFSLPISEASLTPIFESYRYDVEIDRENSGFSVEKQKRRNEK